MLCNVSSTDRVVRFLTAIVVIGAALYFISSPIPKVLALVVAMLLLMSASFGVCLIYRVLGIHTSKPKLVPPAEPQPE